MSDDIDRANDQAQRDLEAQIRAARGIKPKESTICGDCREPLEVHRFKFGRCIDCADALERRR